MTTFQFVLGRGLQLGGLIMVGKTLYQALIVGNISMGNEMIVTLLGFGIFYAGHYVLTLGNS